MCKLRNCLQSPHVVHLLRTNFQCNILIIGPFWHIKPYFTLGWDPKKRPTLSKFSKVKGVFGKVREYWVVLPQKDSSWAVKKLLHAIQILDINLKGWNTNTNTYLSPNSKNYNIFPFNDLARENITWGADEKVVRSEAFWIAFVLGPKYDGVPNFIKTSVENEFGRRL